MAIWHHWPPFHPPHYMTLMRAMLLLRQQPQSWGLLRPLDRHHHFLLPHPLPYPHPLQPLRYCHRIWPILSLRTTLSLLYRQRMRVVVYPTATPPPHHFPLL